MQDGAHPQPGGCASPPGRSVAASHGALNVSRESTLAHFTPDVKGGEKPDQRAEQNTANRGRRGEMVRGGRDEAGGGVSRKRREGVARAQFPAGGDAQIRSSSPCFARGCG